MSSVHEGRSVNALYFGGVEVGAFVGVGGTDGDGDGDDKDGDDKDCGVEGPPSENVKSALVSTCACPRSA